MAWETYQKRAVVLAVTFGKSGMYITAAAWAAIGNPDRVALRFDMETGRAAVVADKNGWKACSSGKSSGVTCGLRPPFIPMRRYHVTVSSMEGAPALMFGYSHGVNSRIDTVTE